MKMKHNFFKVLAIVLSIGVSYSLSAMDEPFNKKRKMQPDHNKMIDTNEQKKKQKQHELDRRHTQEDSDKIKPNLLYGDTIETLLKITEDNEKEIYMKYLAVDILENFLLHNKKHTVTKLHEQPIKKRKIFIKPGNIKITEQEWRKFFHKASKPIGNIITDKENGVNYFLQNLLHLTFSLLEFKPDVYKLFYDKLSFMETNIIEKKNKNVHMHLLVLEIFTDLIKMGQKDTVLNDVLVEKKEASLKDVIKKVTSHITENKLQYEPEVIDAALELNNTLN